MKLIKYGTFNYYNENYVGCDSAYDTTYNQMVFREPENLENINNDFNKNDVIKQIGLLDKEYKGMRSNMRFIEPREFKRGIFAKDHTTIAPH